MFEGNTSGVTGAVSELVFPILELIGGGAGAGNCSLLHSSEQLVFQKPILSSFRSYVTRVLRTTIPVSNQQSVRIHMHEGINEKEDTLYFLKKRECEFG